jgi:hypothetical protein
MTLEKAHDILEWPAVIFMFIALIAGAFNFTLAGFTPIFWLFLAAYFLLMIICMEVTQIRMHLKDQAKKTTLKEKAEAFQ